MGVKFGFSFVLKGNFNQQRVKNLMGRKVIIFYDVTVNRIFRFLVN